MMSLAYGKLGRSIVRQLQYEQRYAGSGLTIIEVQLAQEEVTESPLGGDEKRNSMPAAIMRSL